MSSGKRKYITGWILFAAALTAAIICYEINVGQPLFEGTLLGTIQTIIYLGLAAFWGISVRRRIVHPQIRRLLECFSILVVFWFMTRAIKYYVLNFYDSVENVRRYLWYLYYIPVIFMPTLMMMTAFSLRKHENYRLPKKAVFALLSASAVLFLCVLTNDLHQLVFYFPKDAAVFTDREYGYGFLYYLCFCWNVGCLFIAFAVILKKCRLPNSKKLLWLPIVPTVLLGVYCILYISGNVSFLDDITIVDSFLLMAALELCIAVGLIPSNSNYAELFRASDRAGFITDENLSVIYASEKAEPVEAAVLQRVREQGSLTQGGKRINCSPIKGGYIFWQDDLTKLLEINEILEGTKDELRSYGCLLEEENKQKKRRQKLIEQQSLYETIRKLTEPQQRRLTALSQKLQETTDKEQAEKLLQQITVIGAYVKRRSNLCLLASKSERMPAAEAELCIKESLTYLKLSGITAALRFELFGEVSCETVGKMYDFFQAAVEQSLETLAAITVLAEEEKGKITLRMILSCAADLNMLKAAYPESEIENDGDTWFCSLSPKGGENP